MRSSIDKAAGLSSNILSIDKHRDFKTCCLFCYKNLPSRESGGGFTELQGPSSDLDDKTVERFLKFVTRHLQAPPEDPHRKIDIFEQILSGDHGGGKIGFCEDCCGVVISFCEAYHRMKVAELELDAKLWMLATVMTKADRVNNQVTAKEESLVERARTILLQKCHWRLGHVFPRPLLRKCEASLGTEKREPRRTRRRRTVTAKYRDLDSLTRERTEYKCRHCPLFFGSSLALRRHLQRLHLDMVLIKHKEEATSVEAFTTIVNRVMRRLSLKNKCNICHRQYARREHVVPHLLGEHPQRVSLELRRDQQKIESIPSKSPRVESGKDAPILRSALQLRRQCRICGKVVAKHGSLRNHMRTHFQNQSFKCSYCGDSFRTRWNRRSHEFRLHSERLLADYRADTTSLEDFKRALREAFRSLVIPLHVGQTIVSYECQCCRRTFSHRAEGQHHVVRAHNDSFSQNIQSAQAELATEAKISTRSLESSTLISFPLSPVVQDMEFEELPDPLAGELVNPLGGDGEYKCAHCPLRFTRRQSVTRHELRWHRSKIFASVKDPTLNEKEFDQSINAVLNRFVDGKKCVLCDQQVLARTQREQHIMVSHAQRFCEELKRHQRRSETNGHGRHQTKRHQLSDKNDALKGLGANAQLRFKCCYCPMSFPESSKRRIHALRVHPEHVLATYRKETTSLEDFRVGTSEVFQSLIGGTSKGTSWCQLCKKEYSGRIYCRQHVLYEHSDRFSHYINLYQKSLRSSSLSTAEGVQESPEDPPSRETISAPFLMNDETSPLVGLHPELVHTSDHDIKLEEVESVPIPLFIPKTESNVGEEGGSSSQEEGNLSILGI